MPQFHYSKKEREDMLRKGISEEEIAAKEVEVTNRLAEDKLREGRKRAA